jgi:hypothetical protein
MKRDMDLIRDILLEVEKCPSLEGCETKIPGCSPEDLYYNAQQAQEAGLIDAVFQRGTTHFHITRLTYDGHEFLDAARDNTLWARAKETLIKNTGVLTLEGLKTALPILINKALGG